MAFKFNKLFHLPLANSMNLWNQDGDFISGTKQLT
jgi:hypothetical protein